MIRTPRVLLSVVSSVIPTKSTVKTQPVKPNEWPTKLKILFDESGILKSRRNLQLENLDTMLDED